MVLATSPPKDDSIVDFDSDDSISDPNDVPEVRSGEKNVDNAMEAKEISTVPAKRGSGGKSRKIKESRKEARAIGAPYVTEKGKQIEGRSYKRIRDCRMKCQDKVPDNYQKELFEAYWKLGTRDRRASYISGLIEIFPKRSERKRRMTPEKQKSRNDTAKYFVPLNGRTQVCKGCFEVILYNFLNSVRTGGEA